MAKKSKNKKLSDNTIIVNRKARHEYFLEDHFEAGLMLEGWEVKSLRAGRVSLAESYILLHKGEVFLFGCHITPLDTASTHIKPDPTRNRKLLLHSREISKLINSTNQKGYTIVPVSLYWKKSRVKVDIALAKGKKEHDKRASQKEADWKRDKARTMKGDY